MTMLKEWVKNWLAPWIPSEFLRGAATALMLILALILLFWLVSLFLFLRNRRHHCNQVIVPQANGDIAVSSAAITDAVRLELQGCAQLSIRRIDLFRRRKDYMLEIRCAFHAAADTDGMPELIGRLKTELTEKIRAVFGIRNLKSISFTVVEFQFCDAPDAPLK